MRLQVAFKTRPLRDGGGKPSWGRIAPWARPASTLARLGAKILALTTPFTDQVMWSITCGSKQRPYPDPLLEDIRQILHPGHQHITPDGQPFYLELIGDPDWQYPQILTTYVPLGVSEPTLPSPCGLSRVSLQGKTQWKLHWTTPRDTTITHRQQTSPEKFGPPLQRKSQWA